MARKPVRLRALVDMSLRQSADSTSPLYEQWHDWKAGEEFDAPANLDVDRAIARGIAEEVKRG